MSDGARCPKCGSTNLWDDNFWWGCNDCPFMQNFGPR